MKTSDNGKKLIKKYEGFSSTPYLCPAKVPTIGYGATYYPNGKAVTLKDAPITEKQADEMLSFMLVKYENAVSRYVSVPLTQNQFDALVSFCYNVGQSNLLSSTLLKKLNNKDCKGASNEVLRWNKSCGKVLQGLAKRRKDEREVFLK